MRQWANAPPQQLVRFATLLHRACRRPEPSSAKAWQVVSHKRRRALQQNESRADYVTLRAAEALREGEGRSWLCSALEVGIGHRQQVEVGQIPFDAVNALHLRVITGIKHAGHRDDHRAQAVHGMDSVRVRE